MSVQIPEFNGTINEAARHVEDALQLLKFFVTGEKNEQAYDIYSPSDGPAIVSLAEECLAFLELEAHTNEDEDGDNYYNGLRG